MIMGTEVATPSATITHQAENKKAWLARLKVKCYCTQVEEKGCLCLVFNMFNTTHGWVGASSILSTFSPKGSNW
jgi:hypothetical protein